MTRSSLSSVLVFAAMAAVAAWGCNGSGDDGGGGGEQGSDGGVSDDGGGDSGGCTTRRDCPEGKICGSAGTCVEPPETCESNEDCPAGNICKIDHCEPGCNNASDCRLGEVCREVTLGVQQCVRTCEEQSDCPGDMQCVGDICVPELVLCSPCTQDSDCGGAADLCLSGPGTDAGFCAKDCSLDGRCPKGYRCEQVREGARQCVPAVGECEQHCPLHPCPAGRVCNVETGLCHEALEQCSLCHQDSDCVDGAVCVRFGQDKRCLRQCDGPGDCDAASQCTRGYCVPKSGTCDKCFGKTCSPLTPHCDPEDGVCVECLAARHCGIGEICGASNLCQPGDTHACSEGPCEAPTPFCYGDRCVECLSSGDCPGEGMVCHHFQCMGDDFCQRVECPAGTRCDNEARRCIEVGTCDDDSDCPGRRCDVGRHVCYKADGSCVTNGECPPGLECDTDRMVCIGCETDEDCRPLQKCWPRADGVKYCHQM